MEIELDLSLCTVAGRQPKGVAGLLKTVQETADPVGFEALLAEVEESGATALADQFPGLLVVRLLGLTRLAALNRLLGLSRGRYVALVDDDLLVQPGCLKRLVDFMDDNPDVGLVSPRVIDLYGRTEATCHAFPRLLPMAGLPLPLPPPRPLTTTAEVGWCGGGFHLLRRELLEEIGTLDETLAGLAELDLYWRARQQGWHNFYCHEATVVHARAHRLTASSPWPGQLRTCLRFLKKRLLSRPRAI